MGNPCLNNCSKGGRAAIHQCMPKPMIMIWLCRLGVQKQRDQFCNFEGKSSSLGLIRTAQEEDGGIQGDGGYLGLDEELAITLAQHLILFMDSMWVINQYSLSSTLLVFPDISD